MNCRDSPPSGNLQCGHVLSAVEIRSLRFSSWLSYSGLQCGHVLSAVEMGVSGPHASRTAVLQCGHVLSAVEISEPSMNRAPPVHDLQCGHVLSAVEIWEGGPGAGGLFLLQCGHVLSAVEMELATVTVVNKGKPSMRPRPFGRGNHSNITSQVTRFGSFNAATSFRPWK